MRKSGAAAPSLDVASISQSLPPQGDHLMKSAAGRSPRRPSVLGVYWFSFVCPMISCAVKLIPQLGKALPTKKLSDWSGK